MHLFLVSFSQSGIEFHQRKRKAEKYICTEKFDSALSVYQILFEKQLFIPHSDLYNALLCCIHTKNYNHCTNLLHKLIHRGYVLKDFENRIFDTLKMTKTWSAFYDKYEKYRDEYLFSLNINDRKMIDSMFRIDQKYANTIISDSIFYNQGKKLEKHFDNENKLSFLLNKDTINLKFLVLARHYIGLMNRIAEMKVPPYIIDTTLKLKIVLFNAVESSFLIPEQYLLMTEYFNQKSTCKGPRVIVDFETETLKLSFNNNSYNLKDVNLSRKNLGLSEIDTSFFIPGEKFRFTTKTFPFHEITEFIIKNPGHEYGWYSKLIQDFIIEKINEINKDPSFIIYQSIDGVEFINFDSIFPPDVINTK